MKPPLPSLPLIAALLLAGLAGAHAQQETALVIKGSNTFGEDLGRELVAAFREANPGIAVQLRTPGSTAGLQALIEAQADIAPTSRAATEDELRAARAAKRPLGAYAIGSYGVVVVVNDKNPVRNLTLAQVRDIFTGRITNWRDVGGPDAPIHLYARPTGSGPALGFRELAMRDQPYAEAVQTRPSYEAIAGAVAEDPDGIGYADMRALPAGAKAVLINGIPANDASIQEGLYPYARTLILYTIRGSESTAAHAFVRFVQSREGQRIVGRAGFVPRPAATLHLEGPGS